jgi:hypothetical protein
VCVQSRTTNKTNQQTNTMILQDTTNTIEQIGEVTEQAEFSIKASKKAFSLLSGMYSDIYLGIIQKLN